MWLEITCLNLVTIFNILIENFEKISKRVRLIETVRLIDNWESTVFWDWSIHLIEKFKKNSEVYV